jgi:lipoprotein-anchoring transpeptidase ErfK/SrfK
LVVLIATLVLAALPSASALPAAAATAAVRVHAQQATVALLRAHEARSLPRARSAPLGLVPARTPITASRTVLPVLARRGQWLKVRLPGRPNSHTGWINVAATIRSDTVWHVVVNRSRRQVTVYKSGRPVRTFSAIVGKASTPTPAGEFYVEESVALRPGDAGAPFALALSARSDVFQEFDGGPGQIALHGLTNIGGVLGTAVSHGCIRLAGDTMRWLVVRIGPGVPVTISR